MDRRAARSLRRRSTRVGCTGRGRRRRRHRRGEWCRRARGGAAGSARASWGCALGPRPTPLTERHEPSDSQSKPSSSLLQRAQRLLVTRPSSPGTPPHLQSRQALSPRAAPPSVTAQSSAAPPHRQSRQARPPRRGTPLDHRAKLRDAPAFKAAKRPRRAAASAARATGRHPSPPSTASDSRPAQPPSARPGRQAERCEHPPRPQSRHAHRPPRSRRLSSPVAVAVATHHRALRPPTSLRQPSAGTEILRRPLLPDHQIH